MSGREYETVTVERIGYVERVTLDRPEKRNGLDLAMFEAIIAAGEALAKDSRRTKTLVSWALSVLEPTLV